MLTLVKLNELDTARRGEPYVRMNKNGMVSISPELVRAMKLHGGDTISFAKSEKGKYYILKTDEATEHTFVVREYKKTRALVFNRIKLCRAIMEDYSLQFSSDTPSVVLKSNTIPYKENGFSYFPITRP